MITEQPRGRGGRRRCASSTTRYWCCTMIGSSIRPQGGEWEQQDRPSRAHGRPSQGCTRQNRGHPLYGQTGFTKLSPEQDTSSKHDLQARGRWPPPRRWGAGRAAENANELESASCGDRSRTRLQWSGGWPKWRACRRAGAPCSRPGTASVSRAEGRARSTCASLYRIRCTTISYRRGGSCCTAWARGIIGRVERCAAPRSGG